MIPGINDSAGGIATLSAWIYARLGPAVPLHFSAFHADWKKRESAATPAVTWTRARVIARAAGLRDVDTGNLHDAPGDATPRH